MRYAKLVNGCLSLAPRRMVIGEMWVYNPSAVQLNEMGYLPVVESEPPETDDQHYAVPIWVENDDKIEQRWLIMAD